MSNPPLYNILAIFTLLFLFANPVYSQTFVNPDAQQQWLGLGVQSQIGIPKQACIEGDWVYINNQKLNIGLTSNKSASQSLKEISGKVGASVDLGLIGGGASVEMHSRISQSDLSATLVLKINYDGHDISLQNTNLTATGQSMVGQSATAIEAVCGDQFINHIQLGHQLYLATQLVFNSKEEFEEFITKIKIKVLFVKKTITIVDEFYSLAQNARYSVKVLSPSQVPEALTDIVGNDGELNCRASTLADMDLCVTASNQMLSYIFDPQGYQSWLEDQQNLAVSYFTTSKYTTTPHTEFDEVTARDFSEVLAIHEQLLSELQYQYQIKSRLRAFVYTNNSTVNSPFQIVYLKAVDNIELLTNAIDNCRATPTISHCQTQLDNVQNDLGSLALEPVPENTLLKNAVIDNTSDTLTLSNQLDIGQYIKSANNQYRLLMQQDGDLVLRDYINGKILWSSNTANRNGDFAKLQGDGNFLLRDTSGSVLFRSETHNQGADRLTLNNNGSLVIYSGNNVLWAVGEPVNNSVRDVKAPELTMQGDIVVELEQGQPFTDPGVNAIDDIDGNLNAAVSISGSVNTNVAATYMLQYNVSDNAGNIATPVSRAIVVAPDPNQAPTGGPDVATSTNSLTADQSLNHNEYIESTNGEYKLIMQGDGNLVLYNTTSNTATWASNTSGSDGQFARFQGDGNFLLRDSSGSSIWRTSTHGSGADRVLLNNNGALVIYAGNTVIWSVGNPPP